MDLKQLDELKISPELKNNIAQDAKLVLTFDSLMNKPALIGISHADINKCIAGCGSCSLAEFDYNELGQNSGLLGNHKGAIMIVYGNSKNEAFTLGKVLGIEKKLRLGKPSCQVATQAFCDDAVPLDMIGVRILLFE